MRSEERLKTALEETGLPVKYYEYAGIKPEYIVYNEEADELTNYADNQPQDEVVWWQVHLFAPKDGEFRHHRETLKRALLQEGFTVSEITTLYEAETKTIHVVIPCHTEESEE
ncbi:MAG: hypothetical protein ACLVEV_03815 [Lachnospiraceae bacterium]